LIAFYDGMRIAIHPDDPERAGQDAELTPNAQIAVDHDGALHVGPVQGVGGADGHAGGILALPALEGRRKLVSLLHRDADLRGRMLVDGFREHFRFRPFDGTGDLAGFAPEALVDLYNDDTFHGKSFPIQ
jgi:hypothetical protein